MKKTIIKQCSWCNKEFVMKNSNHVNCSKNCTQKKTWKKIRSGTEAERIRAMDKYRRLNEGKNYRFTYIKYRAHCRKIDFTLLKQDFDTIYGTKCFYCGTTNKVMSLDRVDSSVGYTKENIVSCCVQCNQSKGGYTQKSFIKMCNLIAKNHPILVE